MTSPSWAILLNQSFFCPGVPKRRGSLPSSVARTQSGAAHLPDRGFGTHVPGVEIEEQGWSEAALREVAEALEDHLQILA
jgi:hypothetical protein